MKLIIRFVSVLFLLPSFGILFFGESEKLNPLTRIFIQDHDSRTIKWADVSESKNKNISISSFYENVVINHIDLGSENNKAHRTEAFCNLGTHILCVTGQQATSALVILNAMEPNPSPKFISLNGTKGTKPINPIVTVDKDSKPIAFVFHDSQKGNEADNFLDIIYLDPNKDGNWNDAEIIKNLKVDKSFVQGNFGHHDLSFDADNK